MSVRVRFAPSPTGHLHIGGARTALYNYLLAKAKGGEFILRIEDTDIERSKKEYEQMQVEDLKWLGIDYDEGPDRPGAYGPYRQSERTQIYLDHAHELIHQKKAFFCFCTEEELLEKKQRAQDQNLAPHYDGTCRDLTQSQIEQKKANGLGYAIRFKAIKKEYILQDLVKDEVVFPADMVGDFVIIRSNGMPTYNYSCVVDDWLMKITHVIRGDDHLNNTVRQLMIYEAFEADAPVFGHVSLLVGKDRQKLSKRHGATSVDMYRQQHFLPQALNNYLCLLGWSHPEEKDVFNLDELKSVFNEHRFSKSPAVFDMDKFLYINSQHLRKMNTDEIIKVLDEIVSKDSFYHAKNNEWKTGFVKLFIEKVQDVKEFLNFLQTQFGDIIDKGEDLLEILSWETTPAIQNYIKLKLEELVSKGQDFPTAQDFNSWQDHLKGELKIKGKPLFMGLRGVLTGSNHGADLKELIPLTPVATLLKRIEQL